ncbi:MAG: ABC transporter permease subunit [Lactovum sp.]
MFNKTIFLQTAKENGKVLTVITLVLSLFFIILSKVFSPTTLSSMSGLLQSTPMASMLSDSSFLGLLSNSYYSIQAIILPLIFIIIVASSLIVSKVDRGSMAYLLSTPIKRSTVVFTQAIYLIFSLFVMITVTCITGLLSIQLFYGTVWGEYVSPDIKQIAQTYNQDKNELEKNLSEILENKDYIKTGAESREVSEEVYQLYLNQKLNANAIDAAAKSLDKDSAALEKDLNLILENSEALTAAAKIYNLSDEEYRLLLNQKIKTNETLTSQSSNLQNKLFKGLEAASDSLDMDIEDLSSDLSILLDHDQALNLTIEKSGLSKESILQIINNQQASNLVAEDNGLDFEIQDYLLINLGLFLLMFATSSISFFASCFFNLSNKYMAVGAGIPLAFFLFDMMAGFSTSLEPIKYFTINSLFDTNAILSGENYLWKFIILAIIGIVLYSLSIKIFKSKDLPL